MTTMESKAPHVSVSIQGPSTYVQKGRLDITVTITYHGVPGETSSRPIVFPPQNINNVTDWTDYSMLRHTDKGLEELDSEDVCQFPGDQFPDFINVGGPATSFRSFAAAESYPFEWKLDPANQYVGEMKPGETYTYRFNGKTIPWWDWGTLEDHRGEKIPWDATSHDQRPKIVVAASNELNFKVVAQ